MQSGRLNPPLDHARVAVKNCMQFPDVPWFALVTTAVVLCFPAHRLNAIRVSTSQQRWIIESTSCVFMAFPTSHAMPMLTSGCPFMPFRLQIARRNPERTSKYPPVSNWIRCNSGTEPGLPGPVSAVCHRPISNTNPLREFLAVPAEYRENRSGCENFLVSQDLASGGSVHHSARPSISRQSEHPCRDVQ